MGDKRDDTELSASELLMDVLEEFSQTEGRKILVIYYNESKVLAYRTNVWEDHAVVGMAVMTSDRLRDKVKKGWVGE